MLHKIRLYSQSYFSAYDGEKQDEIEDNPEKMRKKGRKRENSPVFPRFIEKYTDRTLWGIKNV
jgi:hypothetical protein